MTSTAIQLTLLSSEASSAPAQVSVEEGICAHLHELERRARLLTRHPERAEDLVQDTVERALRFKHTFREGRHVRAWLLRIMQNVFLSERRRVSTERRVLDGARVDPNGWATLRPAEQHPDLSPPVARALEDLPEHLRSVLKLVDLGEHSYKEAAEKENVPLGTIMSRLHRGRLRLSTELGPVAA